MCVSMCECICMYVCMYVVCVCVCNTLIAPTAAANHPSLALSVHYVIITYVECGIDKLFRWMESTFDKYNLLGNSVASFYISSRSSEFFTFSSGVKLNQNRNAQKNGCTKRIFLFFPKMISNATESQALVHS